MENINLFLNSDADGLILISFMALIVIHLVYSVLKKNDGNSAYRAEMALSFGILGTFLGIVTGLLGFDVRDIQGSIPQLLSGLQYAFITSISGMISSILIKLTASKGGQSVSAASPESIQAELGRINETLQNNNKLRSEESNDLKDEFKKLISGDNDTSLVNQIKLMKGDLVGQLRENKEINESGFKNLEKNLSELGENLAELPSEAMVEALQQAIVEFNKQLADQLGDNFKELNAGVNNLLEWQNQYKETILETQEYSKELINQLGNATEDIKNIAGGLKPIPQTVQSIEELFANTETSIGLLTANLESFDNMRERAANAFPVIEENITRMTDGFTQSINNVGENLTVMGNNFSESISQNSETIRENLMESSERITEAVTESSNRMQHVGNNLENASETLTESITENQQNVNHVIEEVNRNLAESITEHQQNVNQAIGDVNQTFAESIRENQQNVNNSIEEVAGSIRENQQNINQHIENANNACETLIQQTITNLDEQMQIELTNSINGLGTALASLSNKFVHDYEPLTAKMGELVRISEKIRA